MIKQLEAKEAAEALEATPEAIYLDVRTDEEFGAGHPAGAWNIPVAFFDAANRPTPNPDFTKVVAANLAKDRPLIIGCASGVRSTRAAEALASMGYTDLSNVVGGFAGGKTPEGGARPGWAASGLPVEAGHPEGRSYEALKAKA